MSLTARVTIAEAAVARLIVAKGDRISDLLRQARVRTMAGEASTQPVLYDIAELEAAARGSGVTAAMAKARMRMVRGFDREALLAGTVERQDAAAEDRSQPGRRSG